MIDVFKAQTYEAWWQTYGTGAFVNPDKRAALRGWIEARTGRPILG